MDNAGVKAKVMEALRSRFRPEFLNRIDEFVTFNSLGMEQLVPIVSLELDKVATRLVDRKLTLSVTDRSFFLYFAAAKQSMVHNERKDNYTTRTPIRSVYMTPLALHI